MATKTRNKSFLLRFLIVVFCVYMFITLGSLVKELSSAKGTLATTENETNQTYNRIEEKKNLLENSTREELIERAARESLGYVYPNEQVFVDIN